ncbi:MAG TPA: cytidylate kinase family protein [Chloroflexota bacterium]|nr:cytidylate kinase family protein [Chloroflexota bacterium]
MAVIAISWELGSEGDRIGRVLAEQLGGRLVDGTVLFETAREYDAPGVRPGAPELTERAPSFWERLNEERRRYAVLLRAVMYRFAAEGNCVLLGFGAGPLLREVRHVIRVRIMAPRGLRVERVLAASSRASAMTHEQAEEAVRRTDRDRARYIRYLFNLDINDPACYDLMLNTRSISPLAAVDVLLTLAARPEFQPTPESGAVLDDLALGSQVEAVLLHDPNVWVENLRVTARGGEVMLTGQVLADEDRDVAEAVARRIPGVRIVRNEVSVQPPPLAGM